MLLRRVKQHVKDQNWFAVGIDLLIVVFGVVIGLQAQDWISEQSRRQLELRYTERLHEEVARLLATRSSLMRFREVWLEGVTSATPVIFRQADRDLTPAECEAIAYTYIVSTPLTIWPR